MERGAFLQLLSFALAGGASPLPSPTPSPGKWDECDVSPSLPYNRPIGLKMRALDGPDFDLVKYRGQAVLLHIFATWCGPCNHEMPNVVEAAADYAQRGLAIVGIDFGESDNTVRAFRKRYGITFPIAMDANGTFVKVLEVGGRSNANIDFPVTLFIDPNGYLYCDLVGSVGRAQLRYRIDHFLAAAAGSIAPKPSQPRV
jgi:peroxiredoxin